jgi:hypothetical protein
MKVCKRIVAGLTFLLSAAMLLLSLTGGVGVWIVKEPVTAKATHVFGRVEAALDKADEGLAHVKTSLDNAEERLASVKKKQRELAQKPRNDTLRRALARTVQQTVAPEVSNAHEKFYTIAEAAVVVNSVLEDLGNFPFLSVSGLDGDRLTEINSGLSRVESSAWELSRLFGEPEEPDSDAASTLSRIEQTLKTLRGLIDDYKSRLTEVRQRTEDLKSRTLPWITPAAVLLSLVCFWIALSQVSLLFHACSWWRHAGRDNPRPR